MWWRDAYVIRQVATSYVLRVGTTSLVIGILQVAAALKHHSSMLILRTSTIIFTMKIMIEVLNILQLLHRDSNKSEPVSLCCRNTFPLYGAIFRKISKETGQKDRYRGCAEEARQTDTRGGSNG